MPDKPEVIGCASETYGDEICECCRGRYYNSPKCKRIREGEEDEYQMIYAKPDEPDSVRVFVTIHKGNVDLVKVCANSDVADIFVNRFLKEERYANIDEYSLSEMNGHLDTEFKVYSKNILMGLD